VTPDTLRLSRSGFETSVRFAIKGAPTPYTGAVRSLSDHGILVRTYNLPAVGQRVRLRFRLPFVEELIDVEAEVVWTRAEADSREPDDVGFGARFIAGTRRRATQVPAPGKDGEGRRDNRDEYRTALRYFVEGDARFYTGFARDVTRGGIFVHTYDPPEVGVQVDVTFRVPMLDTIVRLPAEVVWVRDEGSAERVELVGFGARFTRIPVEVAQAINEKLDREADEAEFFE
jgi:uncharacterized protein (TIGR02266 family)